MDHITEENIEDTILELLKREEKDMFTVVLTGKKGIGKTWMARKASLRGLNDGVFDIGLWVYMNLQQSNISLYHNLARQLSIPSITGEIEFDNNELDIDLVDYNEDLEGLKNEILARVLHQRILLILDDEGKKMNIHDEQIKELLQFLSGRAIKVLITSINEDGRHKSEGSNVVIVDLKPLGFQKSLSLFQVKADKVAMNPGDKLVVEEFIHQHIGLTPSEIVVLAKTLNNYLRHSTVQDLKHALKEVHCALSERAIPLIYHDHGRLPSGVLLDFCSQGSHFIRGRAAIHYKDLIAYWIMERFLGDIDHIEEAYSKGHSVVQELMDLQMLKKVDANYFVLESTDLNLKDCFPRGFEGTASLGLANVFADSSEWRGFGELMQADGTIKMIRSERKDGRHSTLLLDGNRLSQPETDNFVLSNEDLQIVVFFASSFRCLPQALRDKSTLNVLVLRGCDYLEKIVEIKLLKSLTVLEVSDARSLTSITDDIFLHMTALRSLNLSHLQVEMLPPSIYDLTELQRLILRGCSKLKRLKSHKRWRKLEVLDLSGAVSFKQFSETSMKSLTKLQYLGLSNTKISFLPFLHQITQLTYLSVSGCKNLCRLPSIESLSKLQVLDLARTNIKELQDKSFLKNVSLRILDLSGALISSLPSKISTRYLHLKACCQIETINCLELSEKLELLDFSGATRLVNIEANSFEHMKNLNVLNLSYTKVTCLPPLSNLQNLRQLLLSYCADLVKLPALNSLTKLEVLDLSGCRALTVLEDKSFGNLSCLIRLSLSETNINELPELLSLYNLQEINLCGVNLLSNAGFLERMSKLRVLDLSETPIEKFPSLSCSENLTSLSLRNCVKIDTLENLEIFTKLEVLDLSGTSVKQLPSLGGLTNLHELLLKDCFLLKELADIQNIDLLGDIRENLPYGISELSKLGHLALPKMRKLENSDSSRKSCSKGNTNQCQWSISSLSKKPSDPNRPLVSLSGSVFFELLNENDSAWDTHFKDFHFAVHPIDLENETGGMYFGKDECISRDIYFKIKRLPYLEEQLRLLEIHGFLTFPEGIEDVLSHATCMLLVDNSFMKSLCDLGINRLNKLKGCWIERCQNMDSLVHADCVEDFTSIETLCISYALNLKSLFIQNLQANCFQSLKHLHLDCLPGLSNVFPSSNYLQNLETLQIKFCDGMTSIFEGESSDHTLPNLHTLRLFEMDNLRNIRCGMPSLRFLEVERCPILEHILPSTCISESLEVIKVKYCKNLQNLLDVKKDVKHKVTSIQTLELWGMPKLISIGLDFTLLPVPCSSIRECPNLQIPVS